MVKMNKSNVIYKRLIKHHATWIYNNKKTCRHKKPTGILKLGYVHFAEALPSITVQR